MQMTTWIIGLLTTRHPHQISRNSRKMSSRLYSSDAIDSKTLAKAWTPRLLESNQTTSSVQKAVERTIPLLTDPSTIPFVCRYRVDVIQPLTTRQVHTLQSLTETHGKLDSLRNKVFKALRNESPNPDLLFRIKTTTSKAELDDWYAPYKPPSKGSILERIQQEHPKLVEQVNAFWDDGDTKVRIAALKPHESLVHLISSKIATEPTVLDKVMEELDKHCRVQTKLDDKKATPDEASKYQTYGDFGIHINRTRDHQVLAIRRGVDKKVLKLSFDIDGGKMEGCVRYQIRQLKNRPSLPQTLLDEAVHDAWSRVLRRKGTSRLWTAAIRRAQERALEVFCDNTSRALLAPPPSIENKGILSVDPGFQAGLKCAILDENGLVVGPLTTVKYMGQKERIKGVQDMRELIEKAAATISTKDSVIVTLGNGHGTQAARELVEEAASSPQSIAVDIQLVHEAGASVWSVSEQAQEEFPNDPPAAIAAVSIGRRWQNPLHELIKIPPMSLGLGMYQHDLSKPELENELHRISVDAVAQVGVDVNSCRIEILRKVPGLTSLGDSILQARPLNNRKDLLSVPRLGPKTFEACAGFLRIADGNEPLDDTLVHPESYSIARWLLGQLDWHLNSVPTSVPPRDEWSSKWSDLLEKGADKFGVSTGRILSVVGNLHDSIFKVDPRVDSSSVSFEGAGAKMTYERLPGRFTDDVKALSQACPLRGIVGTIRNLADFGAFIDFGGPSDGLLHVSKLQGRALSSLLIGEEIGIDILQVQGHRFSLGLSGDNRTTRAHSESRPQHSQTSRPVVESHSKRKYSTDTATRPRSKKQKSSRSR